MSETRITVGGAPVSSLTIVQCDQETVLGDGSHDHPLRAGPGFASVAVRDEGVPLGTFTAVDLVGPGVSASDAGGGVARVVVPGGVTLRDEGAVVLGGPHRTIDFVGPGVEVADAGGGAALVSVPGASSVSRSVLVWGLGLLTSRPAFVQCGGTGLPPAVSDSYAIVLPYAATARNMYVRHNTAGGTVDRTASYILYRNGSPTSLAVSIPTGDVGVSSNVSDVVVLAAGDAVSIRVDSDSFSGIDEFDAKITVEIVA